MLAGMFQNTSYFCGTYETSGTEHEEVVKVERDDKTRWTQIKKEVRPEPGKGRGGRGG